MPPLRRPTRIYISSLGLLAVVLTAYYLSAVSQAPTLDNLVLAGAFALALALAILFPIPFAWKTRYHLDTSVIIAVVLIFEPGVSLAIIILGSAVAHAVRRESWAQSAFNAAHMVVQAAVAGIILQSFGWVHTEPHFGLGMTAFGILVAGAAMYVVNTLAVAIIIGLQEGLPLLRLWYRVTANMDRMEAIAHLSQIGVGVLAAVVTDAHAWAIALLFLPAFAIYLSLEHHTAVRRRVEEMLRGTEANLKEAQRIAHLGSWDRDLITNDTLWSDEACRILGIERALAIEQRDIYLERVHPDDRAGVDETIARALSGVSAGIDHRIVRPDGTVRFVQTQVEAVLDRRGMPSRLLGTIHDITERKQLEEHLTHQAFHDTLTGLPNRALFTDRLQHALTRTQRYQHLIAVLFLDLDHFKRINDTLGHEAGDQLLITVAERIRGCVRPSDTVARLGGDEFTILLEGLTSHREAEVIAQRIITALENPFALLHQEIVISTSIGIVFGHTSHLLPDDLLRDADLALYRAKDAGRARYTIYDVSMGDAMQARLSLELDLRYAIERGELHLAYQPVVRLVDRQTIGFEAFVRWLHPERGLISPQHFIPVAEEAGLVATIDRWVLEEVCQLLARWQEKAETPLFVSVNVSGHHLHRHDLVALLQELVVTWNIDPRSLTLEVAESAIMQNIDAAGTVLTGLSDMGIDVVIDDFGKGYSNLTQLMRLPIHVLKLDTCFVASLHDDERGPDIARAVIGLAHSLHLKVVAEGIERRQQFEHLRALGCEFGQGNYLSPPVSAEHIPTILLNQSLLPERPERPERPEHRERTKLMEPTQPVVHPE